MQKLIECGNARFVSIFRYYAGVKDNFEYTSITFTQEDTNY